MASPPDGVSTNDGLRVMRNGKAKVMSPHPRPRGYKNVLVTRESCLADLGDKARHPLDGHHGIECDEAVSVEVRRLQQQFPVHLLGGQHRSIRHSDDDAAGENGALKEVAQDVKRVQLCARRP